MKASRKEKDTGKMATVCEKGLADDAGEEKEQKGGEEKEGIFFSSI